jgi:alpha-L-fucosidase
MMNEATPHSSDVGRRSFLGTSAVVAAGVAATSAGWVGTAGPAAAAPPAGGNLQELQQRFVDMRFGMFIHFNMGTFHDAQWVEPGQDPLSFAPSELECRQWAAAAKSAGMTFAVLTVKHHDGFCLWPTQQTAYNVMSSSYRRDVVAEYFAAFRAEGVIPALYFSIWDRRQGIAAGSVSTADMSFIKAQLTELLTGYGDVPVLVIDGWAWEMGHREVSYAQIREHVKSVQPDILIVDHNGLTEPFEEDVLYFEEPKGIWAPEANTYASCQGRTS